MYIPSILFHVDGMDIDEGAVIQAGIIIMTVPECRTRSHICGLGVLSQAFDREHFIV